MGPAADDWGLLAAYATGRDEQAFAALVRRHVNLVYCAAARRVGDRHLAEDVTQAVFLILANKAKSMRHDGPLSAWLLTTVRYAAANALKMESRRHKHESRAAHAAGACSANPTDVLVWQEVARQLDDEVLRLPSVDRRAVLLRYFENRPIVDIAADLNVSEGAAKQRLSRAMDKLRKRLDRRGVAGVASMGSAGLASLLASHIVTAAPIGLTNTACAAACGLAAGATTASTAITIAKGALNMMTWTKLKIAAAVLVAVSIGGTAGVVTVKNAIAAERPPAAGSATRPDAAQDAPARLKKKDNMGIISVQDAPPVVISTVPQAGSADVDAATTTELKVVFNKEMDTGGFSWVQYGKDTFPKTTGKAHFLDDKRTCVLPVKLEPGHPYVIWLNQGRFTGFADADGNKAVPYLLVFETK
jgi:RNA polymerase sigma factor (sigma-70 family)